MHSQVPIPFQELEEQGRLVEDPAALGMRERAAKQLDGLIALQKVVLVGCFFVSVPGRNHHPLDAQIHQDVEHFPHPPRMSRVEHRGIRRDAEAGGHRDANCPYSDVENSLAADGDVVLFTRPIDVH